MTSCWRLRSPFWQPVFAQKWAEPLPLFHACHVGAYTVGVQDLRRLGQPRQSRENPSAKGDTVAQSVLVREPACSGKYPDPQWPPSKTFRR